VGEAKLFGRDVSVVIVGEAKLFGRDVSTVIARSGATKQSTIMFVRREWRETKIDSWQLEDV
jgi:hypothetical protein